MCRPVIRIYVIDDHDIVHAGIRAVTEAEPDLTYVGGATSIRDGLAGVEETTPDLVLLDFRIGTEDSLDACEEIRSRRSDVRILMFSGYGNPSLLARAIQAGADGYVLKDAGTRQLPMVIRECVEAGEYFDPRVAGSLLRAQFSPAGGLARRAGGGLFSERELEIIRCIAKGWTTHEIAAELHVSAGTVKHDVAGMLARLAVRRRAELVRVAADQYLI